MGSGARTAYAAATAALVAMLVAGCTGSSPGPSAATSSTAEGTAPVVSDTAGLALSRWGLRGVAGADGVLRDPVTAPGPFPGLQLDTGGVASGGTGCAEIAGTYVQSGSNLTLSMSATSTTACSSPEAIRQSDDMLAALPRVRSFSFEDGVLDLRDEAGTVLLSLRSGLTTLPGTTWTVTGVRDDGGSLAQLLPGESPLRLAFDVDRTLEVTTACGTSSAPFTLEAGGALVIVGLAPEAAACSSAGSELGPAYLAALADVRSWSFDRSVLSLSDAAGTVVLELRPAPY